jgi:hypothetical protein
MSRLHDFERLIDDKLRSLFRGPVAQGAKREMVEVHRAILDDIASRVESLPRGRRTFSYPHVVVQILLPSPERRRAYEVAFVEGDSLARDARSLLEQDDVELPERVRIEVELVEELPEGVTERGFDVSYRSEGPAQVPVEVPAIWLTVVNGKADREEYRFRKTRINLGRLTYVLDAQQRPIRRNDVAFEESSGGANPSVSRTHAHIEFETASGQFRLFDDRSAQGTSVFREGGVVSVPKGMSKGVALRTGDEIALGQARVRFAILAEDETV